MLVVSAGMQKSGSGYLYNLINELIKITGGADARQIKTNHGLKKIMRSYNNNIKRLDILTLLRLIAISKKYGSFVVKTHQKPSLASKGLQQLDSVKTVYIHRDPRDVLLSLIDHGNKINASGLTHDFGALVTFSAAFAQVVKWTEISQTYQQSKYCLCVRYEDLLEQPMATLKKVCRHITLPATDEQIERVLSRLDRNNADLDKRGLHFNKAEVNRYKNELSNEEKACFSTELGAYLIAVGYEKS